MLRYRKSSFCKMEHKTQCNAKSIWNAHSLILFFFSSCQSIFSFTILAMSQFFNSPRGFLSFFVCFCADCRLHHSTAIFCAVRKSIHKVQVLLTLGIYTILNMHSIEFGRTCPTEWLTHGKTIQSSVAGLCPWQCALQYIGRLPSAIGVCMWSVWTTTHCRNDICFQFSTFAS